jgi:hypothetical protein
MFADETHLLLQLILLEKFRPIIKRQEGIVLRNQFVPDSEDMSSGA